MRRSGSALLLTLLLLCSGYVVVQSVSSAGASASLTSHEVEDVLPSNANALIGRALGAKQPDAPIVVRIYGDEEQLRRVAQHLDVWEVHREAGYLVAMRIPVGVIDVVELLPA